MWKYIRIDICQHTKDDSKIMNTEESNSLLFVQKSNVLSVQILQGQCETWEVEKTKCCNFDSQEQ
jgi:hypothetical protein